MSAAVVYEFPTAPPLSPGSPTAHDAESVVTRAESALAEHAYEEAATTVARATLLLREHPGLELRGLLAAATALMYTGDIEGSLRLLERARALAETPTFSDVDRAAVLFRVGCCRVKLSAVANAVELFTVALELCDRSGLQCDRLRAEILHWRIRCYRRQRDWSAASEDADRALQLVERLDDPRLCADAYLQASTVAERTGQLLVARFYAESAAESYQHAGNPLDAGKALNNLGGICFLLGRTAEAKDHLAEAFRIALECGHDIDAAYAVSSTAQVALRGHEFELAETNARYALELLAGRDDHVNELGSAQVVLGRALMEQGRFAEADEALAAADESFKLMDSLGHRSHAWLAQGDLAARQGDLETAATVYRRAAESLQDVRF